MFLNTSPCDVESARSVETVLKQHNLVTPAYAGRSVGNLASTVLQVFGADATRDAPGLLPPVDPHVLPDDLIAGARVVVLIVVDGLSVAARARNERSFRTGPLPDVDASLTSVFPSTTAAALTTLQLGVAPATHGMVGYTLLIPSLGRVVNMVTFKPVDGGPLPDGSIDLAGFVAVPTVYDHLAAHGIESVVVSHREYSRSPLTIVQSGDTPYIGHRTAAEMAGLLYRQATMPARRFIFGYWAGVDMLAHTYGPRSEQCDLELRLLDQALRDGFLAPLARRGDDVVVILTADHGHATVLDDHVLPLNDLSAAVEGWAGPPTGERRAVGLSLGSDSSRAQLQHAVGNAGVVMSSSDAVSASLYGPPPHHPELQARTGDTLLLSTGSASFPYRPGRKDGGAEISPGAHGSLTPEEMLVPFVVWRFGR